MTGGFPEWRHSAKTKCTINAAFRQTEDGAACLGGKRGWYRVVFPLPEYHQRSLGSSQTLSSV